LRPKEKLKTENGTVGEHKSEAHITTLASTPFSGFWRKNGVSFSGFFSGRRTAPTIGGPTKSKPGLFLKNTLRVFTVSPT
jgi:hypothetical protein